MKTIEGADGTLWLVANDGWIVGNDGGEAKGGRLPLFPTERSRRAVGDGRRGEVRAAPDERTAAEAPVMQLADRPSIGQDLEACGEVLADSLLMLGAGPADGLPRLGTWSEALPAAWQFGVLWQAREREIGALVDFFTDLRRKAGAVLAPATTAEGGSTASSGLHEAVNALLQTSLRAYHRAVTLEHERAASRDWLTGVHNRAYLQRRLRSELQRATRFKHPLGLLMIDLDGFKAYNDTFGHAAGDQVLQHVSQIFVRTARTIDVVARYGGDEFVIIMPETGTQGAAAFADRLTARLLAAQEDEAWPYPALTLSYGIATFPDDAADDTTLLAAADAWLCVMKRAR